MFLGTIDARLIALDAQTGKLLWQTQLGDKRNDGNHQVTSAPAVVGETVIIGSAIGDNSRAEMALRRVLELGPHAAGKTGAANAWSSLAMDAARDLFFLPTGSASPDFYGGLRPGGNRHANSVVALRASTGKSVWAFQVVHDDLWDHDVSSRPALIEIGGKPAIGVLTKMGHYFALDLSRVNRCCRWKSAPWHPADVPGEAASPTQLFPKEPRRLHCAEV